MSTCCSRKTKTSSRAGRFLLTTKFDNMRSSSINTIETMTKTLINYDRGRRAYLRERLIIIVLAYVQWFWQTLNTLVNETIVKSKIKYSTWETKCVLFIFYLFSTFTAYLAEFRPFWARMNWWAKDITSSCTSFCWSYS